MCTNITQTLEASGHLIFFLIPIPRTRPCRKQGSTSNDNSNNNTRHHGGIQMEKHLSLFLSNSTLVRKVINCSKT